MGWKASLIIIEDRNHFSDEVSILKAIGKSDHVFEEEVMLNECLYPNDGSVCIGRYKGNIIICDDFQLTNVSLSKAKSLDLTAEEKALVVLFPDAEIVSAACHSAVNYHGYSLIKAGRKLRLKTISADEKRKELGARTAVEEKLYAGSFVKDGESYWKDTEDTEEESSEDQMMEHFAFGFAAQRLGVKLDEEEGDELMERIAFKKYVQAGGMSASSGKKARSGRWLVPVITIVIIIAWRIIRYWMKDHG